MVTRPTALLAMLALVWPIAGLSADFECPGETKPVKGKSDEGFLADWCENEKGERHGPFVAVRANGEAVVRSNYEAGKLHGEYESWFANGNKEKQGQYHRGEVHGDWTRWYESGQKKDEVQWSLGKPDGSWEAWHENGKLKAKGAFRNGKETGEWTFWREDGGREKQGAYADGKQICTWKTWDVQGELTEREYASETASCGGPEFWNHFSVGFGGASFTRPSGEPLEVPTTFIAVHPTMRLNRLAYIRGTFGVLKTSEADAGHDGVGFLAYANLGTEFWKLFAELGLGMGSFPGEGTKGSVGFRIGPKFEKPLLGFIERIEFGANGWGKDEDSEDSKNGMGYIAVGLTF